MLYRRCSNELSALTPHYSYTMARVIGSNKYRPISSRLVKQKTCASRRPESGVSFVPLAGHARVRARKLPGLAATWARVHAREKGKRGKRDRSMHDHCNDCALNTQIYIYLRCFPKLGWGSRNSGITSSRRVPG
jgi:hypothetical protein